MPTYRTPGVYFEWLDVRKNVITPLRTDVAGFVGITERGPIHRPVRIDSWVQFVSIFGRHIPQGLLAYSVEGFFANGGRTCWVVRVADPETATPAACELRNEHNQIVLELVAATSFIEPLERTTPDGGEQAQQLWLAKRADPGVWGRRIRVRVSRSGRAAVGRAGTMRERFSLDIQLPGGEREFWRDLTLDKEDHQGYVETLLNNPVSGSRLVTARRQIDADSALPPRGGMTYLSKGGRDGLSKLTLEHFAGIRGDGDASAAPTTGRWGLSALELIDEVSIVAMPDIMTLATSTLVGEPPNPRCDIPERPVEPQELQPATVAVDAAREQPPAFDRNTLLQLQRELIAHCELLKDRVALLDPRYEDITQAAVLAWRDEFDTRYAGLYYPWLMVPDPLRLNGLLRAVPPSGHIAGIYARVDERVGVHKPPANEELAGVLDVATSFFDAARTEALRRSGRAERETLPEIDDIAHGDLNEHEVNLIRAYPGRGVRIMGARTLSSDWPWRYINVRRLVIMIEEAIDEQTQWIVFESINQALWREIERVVSGFLDRLWQRGMLDGDTAEAAYSVTCDATTNPPEEIERGRIICQVRVLPPWPAEYVILRIGKTQDRVEILEERGGR
ncbi:MAG TPA: phage tail sheath subtilisin-like domain-containing protein [Herpetosiphonaceae bacterium]